MDLESTAGSMPQLITQNELTINKVRRRRVVEEIEVIPLPKRLE